MKEEKAAMALINAVFAIICITLQVTGADRISFLLALVLYLMVVITYKGRDVR